MGHGGWKDSFDAVFLFFFSFDDVGRCERVENQLCSFFQITLITPKSQ